MAGKHPGVGTDIAGSAAVPARPAWHAMETGAVAAELGTDPTGGLSEAEAANRLDRYGPNVLEVSGRTRWYVVLGRQFLDVLIVILGVAAVVSAWLGEVTDAITILIILVLNGVLGFVQEWRAERAIEALQEMLALDARVVRDGREQSVDATRLVPGDVVLVEVGAQIPADLRNIQSVDLKVDESALTGESESVAKSVDAVGAGTPLAEQVGVSWMGTTVTNGRARGIVVGTGMATEFGRIAELTQSVAADATPLQRRLARLGTWLGIIAVAISVGVAVTGWALGRDLEEMFFTGVSLAVAVVPEGLPAVVTITLALGIRRMVARKALLRRLQAAETLGAATVICTDKTGTLTQNEMTVRRVWVPSGTVEVTGVGYDPTQGTVEADSTTRHDLEHLLETALWCNHAGIEEGDSGWHSVGEPTEAALVTLAAKAGMAVAVQPAGEFSFNSRRKRMTVLQRAGGGLIAHTKGAPEMLLPLCSSIGWGDGARPLDEDGRRAVVVAYESFAGSGFRTLALARRVVPAGTPMTEEAVEQDLALLGVVAILDPPRSEVPGAVAEAKAAGISVVMITGDAPATAVAIAEQVGLDFTRAVGGSELNDLSDAALRSALAEGSVFARTTPEHKLRIVSLLQGDGEVVGMTGDGVNDAPALKQADIGIAMGLRGTDVAKGASDMILTDDNFASIIGAIGEGRRQYDNIQKFIRYLLSSNTGEMIAVFVNILLNAPLILLPVQILWMNLVTDGLTALALGVEPSEEGIMSRPPRAPDEPILSRRSLIQVVGFGAYIGIGALFLFHFYRSVLDRDLVVAQTMAFTGMVVLEHMNVFNFRALHAPIRVIGFFSNPWLLVAWAGTISLQLAVVYVPFLQDAFQTTALGAEDWLWIAAVSVPIFIIGEAIKTAGWRAQAR
ncbi:MAG: cation-transporting P-type ATPase [Acidimicrobiia bacterium]|nr:cation-transporting P-type ATPase [Acidimicrobiia bacterium]